GGVRAADRPGVGAEAYFAIAVEPLLEGGRAADEALDQLAGERGAAHGAGAGAGGHGCRAALGADEGAEAGSRSEGFDGLDGAPQIVDGPLAAKIAERRALEQAGQRGGGGGAA